jgi:serine/threonine protein kinase
MFSKNNPYFTPEALTVIKKIYKKVYPKEPDDVDDEQIEYFLMFTIMSGTMSLEDAFKQGLIDTGKHFKAIIFQVAFSLCKLHQAGIQHNDLHFGNILIDTSAVGEIKYTTRLPLSNGSENLKDVTFVVPINNCKILLYDWDLGLADCGINEFLEGSLCNDYGVCNDLNIKFDFYTFMRGFDQYMGNRLNLQFTKFRQEMLKTKLHEKYEMRMCNSNTGDEKIHCLPFPEGEPAEVMTPYDALQNKYFDDFNPEEKGEYYG